MIEKPGAANLLRYIAFLKASPLFADVQEGVLAYVVNDFRIRTYRKKEVIFHQGDESRSLSLIIQGKVRIYHLTPGGDETTVNILHDHDVLGEFSAIDGKPRSAAAEAITACMLLEINSQRWLHHLETIPGLGLAMCRLLVQKVRWTSMYAETISRLDAAGRLLHFLLLYNEEFGEEVEPGKRYVVDLGLTQGDLATLVGTRRPWISEILNEWKDRGLVEFDKGRLTILDLPRVQEERDSRVNGMVGGLQ